MQEDIECYLLGFQVSQCLPNILSYSHEEYLCLPTGWVWDVWLE
jgi:hypothetical protein